MNEKYLQTKNDYLFMCGSGRSVRKQNQPIYEQKKQHNRGSDLRRDEPITPHKPMATKQNGRISDLQRDKPIKLSHASTTEVQLTVEQQKAEQEGMDEFIRATSGISKPLTRNQQKFKAYKEKLKEKEKEKEKTQQHQITQLYKDAARQIENEAKQKNAEFNESKIVYIKNDTVPNEGNEFKINIDKLNFTQKTASHKFSDNTNTITSNVEYVVQFYKDVLSNLKRHGISDEKALTSDEICISFKDPNMLKINVIKNNDIWYACDNRRLCMLKILYNLKIFDGEVSCTHIINCYHNCVPIQNDSELLIIMGDRQPAKTIKKITDEFKKKYKL